MRMKKYIIGLLLGGVLTACATADVLTYDQLQPAEINFPAEIRQVGIVNNMPLRANAPTNDLILGVMQGEGSSVAETLAGTLADSKYFNEVVICDSALQQRQVNEMNDPQLSADQIQTLSRDLGVDMLIACEGLWVETTKKQVQYPGWDMSLPVILATITPVVRLYLPDRVQPLHTIVLKDSLLCDIDTPISEKLLLEESTKLAANKIANYLVPSWTQTDRVYFSGGCVEMRDAAVYLHEGSWQEAQDIWMGLYNQLRKGKTKARAAYNIALSYEMLGNVEEALKWIKQSQKFVAQNSKEQQLVKLYAEELERRMKEVVSLKSQMGRFNDNF